jgi:protein involved in polysaccharide export with SLBB domain
METIGLQKAAVWLGTLGLTGFLLMGCATAPPHMSAGSPAVMAATAQASVGKQPLAPPPNYVLQPGDQLTVRFYYHPDNNQDLIVQPDGKIVLPRLGELTAAGQKPEDLAKQIAQGYSDILRDPEVDVQVKQFAGQRIYVGGEVTRPGFVDLSAGMTTLQAIVQAGGFRDTAKLSNIVVVRYAAQTDGAKPEGILVNLQEVVEGQDFSKDLALQPHDIVYVPQTSIAKVNQFVDQYIVRVLPIRPSLYYGF